MYKIKAIFIGKARFILASLSFIHPKEAPALGQKGNWSITYLLLVWWMLGCNLARSNPQTNLAQTIMSSQVKLNVAWKLWNIGQIMPEIIGFDLIITRECCIGHGYDWVGNLGNCSWEVLHARCYRRHLSTSWCQDIFPIYVYCTTQIRLGFLQ